MREPPTGSAPADVAEQVERIFTEVGAYREGHFALKSGRHADRYIEKFAVLQWPEHVAELCALVVGSMGGRVDVVLGPTMGGVILAFECARRLGVRGIFAEQVAGEDGRPQRVLRRGFGIEPGERVLLVDDVVTTGASLVEMVPVVEQADGQLAAIVVLVDRSGSLAEVASPDTGRRYPATALWSLALPTYEPGAGGCPGCAAGLPLYAPGSSGAQRG